jgi:acyl-CoA thioesterase-1
MRILLIFCYFSLFVLVNSCNETTEKSTETTQTEVSEETKVANNNTKSILFFGNSLTAGLGVDTEEAFPTVIQRRIDSLQLPYQVINAGLSGETTASGKNRVSWILNQPIDVFVLELGANDGLRGIPISETKSNLQAIIDTVKEKNPKAQIILTGIQIPPNMGPEYTEEFRNVFPELAEKNNIQLIPFLLENVGGVAELNQQDGIHPTAEGHKILAENVWVVLQEVL